MKNPALTALACMAGMAFALTGAASADPVVSADDAAATIIEVTATKSKPFYNGSYYTIELSSPEACTLVKTLKDFSAEGEHKKTVTTIYEVAKIDPSKVQPDHLGGVKFWSLGEEAVFSQETVMGGDFSMMIPGDNLTVRDEATETDMLVDALKSLIAHCAG